MTKDMRLCVPVLGSATNLEAIIASGIKPALVIVDRPCRGEDVAVGNGLLMEKLYRREFYKEEKFDRIGYTDSFIALLQKNDIYLVPMAGFLTVLGPKILELFGGRLINLHPSLFSGMEAVYPGSGNEVIRTVLARGDKETGSTIHLATEILDAGPVLGMSRVPVMPDDTMETLWERVKVEERKLYPETIKRVLAGEIDLDAKWQEWLDR